MVVHTFSFRTRDEADAFIEGVEFVNDSTVEIEGVVELGDDLGYEVRLIHTDFDSEEVDVVRD